MILEGSSLAQLENWHLTGYAQDTDHTIVLNTLRRRFMGEINDDPLDVESMAQEVRVIIARGRDQFGPIRHNVARAKSYFVTSCGLLSALPYVPYKSLLDVPEKCAKSQFGGGTLSAKPVKVFLTFLGSVEAG